MTLAFSATRRSPIPLSGENQRSLDWRSRATVPELPWLYGLCRDVERCGAVLRTAARRNWRYADVDGQHFGVPHRPRRSTSTRPPTCNISRRRTGRGSASTGAMIAAWWQVRCPAREAIATTGRTGPTRSSMPPSSLPTSSIQAGLYCAGVYATPTTPISPNSICPASQYGSKYLTIPAAGTENDDHNPPRIASRNLFDIAIGQDNLLRGDKFKLSAAPDGCQSHRQRSGLQLPFHLQRNALRYAARDHGDHRVPFLTEGSDVSQLADPSDFNPLHHVDVPFVIEARAVRADKLAGRESVAA